MSKFYEYKKTKIISKIVLTKNDKSDIIKKYSLDKIKNKQFSNKI